MSSPPLIGLVDCNNFFVSCERAVNPQLNNRAVVVMSNNDGCAVARSNEAKALGVKMGQPMFELRDLINRGELIALSGNHILYHDISVKVHNIFRRYAPSTIDYSVDEAFLDMGGMPESAVIELAKIIHSRCQIEQNIPVTIGISTTKTLAKVATELGKRSRTPIVLLNDEKQIQEVLKTTGVGDIWGIGRRMTKRLYFEGVKMASDLLSKDSMWVKSIMGINGIRICNELRGIPSIDLSACGREIQEMISETRTFDKDTNDFDFLRMRITGFVSHCCARLREMNTCCTSVTVFIRTNRFHSERGYYCPSIEVQLSRPSDDTQVILNAAMSGFMKIFDSSKYYKRAGIVLSKIIRKEAIQMSLFDDNDDAMTPNDSNLMKVIDNINKDSYQPTLRLASQMSEEVLVRNTGYSSSFQFKK